MSELAPRVPVQSSNVAAVGYHGESRTLTIEFKGKGDQPGRIYDYPDVPPEAHEALMNAESIGSHLAAVIRPNYTGLPREQGEQA